MIKNVILYPRVSGSKQSKYGESLEYQEEQCRAFCERNGYQVLSVFKEQFTGTKDKRPKLKEALEFIKKSELKIDHVIVFKVDRVSRGGITIHENFKKQFQVLGVSVKDTFGVICEDKNALEIKGIDTNKYSWAKDTTNKLTENVTVMMSENERNTILQRMLGQSIRNGMRGYKTRNSDFGFMNKKVMTPMGRKTIQVENKEESVYIKKMFELRARGDLSDKEITEEINLMGFKSRQRTKWNSNKTEIVGIIGGNPISSEQLQRYIKSTIYAGIICEEWTGNKAVKAPYQGLVSIELWNKANRGKYQINLNKDEITIDYYNSETKIETPIFKKPKNYNPEYPYSKVLQCPLCSGHLTAEKSKSRNGKYHHYYSCRGKNGVKHKNYSLKRDIINDDIVKIFTSLNIKEDGFGLFEHISKEVFKDREKEHKNKSIEKNKRIYELESKQKSISNSIVKLIDFPDLLEVQNLELQEIKRELAQLQAQNENVGNKIGLNKFLECSKKVLTHLDKLVLQRDKPELIQLIFEIVFDGSINYERLKSHTPIISGFSALNTKKDFQNIGKSSLNRKWWVTSDSYHTLRCFIVDIVNKIDSRQNMIDNIDYK